VLAYEAFNTARNRVINAIDGTVERLVADVAAPPERIAYLPEEHAATQPPRGRCHRRSP
jgi:hypothetical protein